MNDNLAPLPDCFKAPQQEEYTVGLPFWEGSKEYRNLADVPINTTGFTCLGCEPGSAPDPFIVVFNDGRQLGLISPYVTVLYRVEPKSTQYVLESCGSFMFPGGKEEKKKDEKRRHVTVQVNGDTLGARRNVKKQAELYKVSYTTYDEIKTLAAQGTCFNFGNFGNCALPNHADEYEAPWDCEMIVFQCECGVVGNSMDFKHAKHGSTKPLSLKQAFLLLYGKAGGCWTLTDADNAPFGINTPLFGRFEDPRLCSGHASSLLLLFGDVDKDGFRNRIEISLQTAQEGEKSQLVVRRNTVANEFDDEERCWTLVRSFPMKQLVEPCENDVRKEEEGEESE